jgi:Zn-dependent metalloprotease/chitodextrinase
MKKLFLLIFITTLFQVVFAQVYNGSVAQDYAQGADIVRFKEHSKVPAYIKFKENYSLNVEKALEYTKSFIHSENCDFGLKNIQQNGDNSQTYRYFQTVDGYKIEFSAWNVHVKGGKVTAMNGDIFDNVTASTEFSISEEKALKIALEYFGAESYMWEDEKNEQMLKKIKKDENATHFPATEKLIVPNKIKFSESKLRPAYKFEIYASKPHDKKAIYVDAQTGEVLFDLPLIHFTSVVGTAHTQYSGIQQITTEYNGSVYLLEDHTRGNGIITFNANNYPDYDNATQFTDNDNIWNNVNASLDEYATDAHFATTKTYDYFDSIHGRNSIDGYGHQLVSYIHFDLIGDGYPTNVNAFWNGYCMTYGDGDMNNGITPLTSIDICAHEITHGLTQHTAGLVYYYESGALNEAFSDIFGAAVEFYAVPNLADWTMGEDINYIMRSLENPKAYENPDTYKGTYWEFTSYDNGGVHTNSGPMYYWFYLLCEGGSGTNDLSNNYSVTAIGIEKAEKIAFTLLTQYLTSTSDYQDAYYYGLQAASDIYGACSPEVQSVGDAFYAIGLIEQPYINAASSIFSTANNQSCAAPFTVNFTNSSYNCDTYLWDFGDGTTSTQQNPTHTYTQYGTYDVKLLVSSSNQNCGADSITKIDYIVIDSELECITIMPVNDYITIQGCNGFIYDPGGPDGNYYDETYSVLTIYSPGASSILLNILEFDIEGGDYMCYYDYIAFYDGSSTDYSLIIGTNYCNATGNPQIISSTGEYLTILFYADEAVNLSGFKIEYYCINDTSAPTPLFFADKPYSCDGWIQFTDASINNPTSWLWDFGDGATSTQQNPNHLYTSEGIYNVRLTTTNEFGSNSLIKNALVTIGTSEAPEIDDIIACVNTDFDINLNLDGTAYWYNDTLDEMPVYSGNFWVHAPVAQPKTYYVREEFGGEKYNLGATNNTSGGAYFGNESYIHYLVFDAYKPFILNSVSVNAQGDFYRKIAIQDNTGKTLLQKTVFIFEGVSRVDLDMEIPQGTDLRIVGLDAPYLYRTDNLAYVDYPYIIDDVVSIKHSSATDNEYEYYYYFYDWEISTITCMSDFTTATLIPETCNSIIDNELFNNIFIAPNPNNGTFEITGLENAYFSNIEITDVFGKTLFSHNNFTENILNLTHFADGFYFLKISNEKGQKVIKFVIKK